MDKETLRELILGELGVHPEGAIELAYRLDQDPRDVLQVLQELEQEERVVHTPREGWEWRVVE